MLVDQSNVQIGVKNSASHFRMFPARRLRVTEPIKMQKPLRLRRESEWAWYHGTRWWIPALHGCSLGARLLVGDWKSVQGAVLEDCQAATGVSETHLNLQHPFVANVAAVSRP